MTTPLPPPSVGRAVGEPVPRPELDALLAAAARLRAQAEVVRGLARTVVASAASTGWRSTAATACRRRLADHAEALLGAAALSEYAAAAVADHARTAAARADAIVAAAGTAAGVAAGTVTTGVGLATGGVARASEAMTAAPGEVVSTLTGWTR